MKSIVYFDSLGSCFGLFFFPSLPRHKIIVSFSGNTSHISDAVQPALPPDGWPQGSLGFKGGLGFLIPKTATRKFFIHFIFLASPSDVSWCRSARLLRPSGPLSLMPLASFSHLCQRNKQTKKKTQSWRKKLLSPKTQTSSRCTQPLSRGCGVVVLVCG